MSVLVPLVLSTLVGVSLGLLGGGGSILAVPVLVYAASVPARTAVPMSLALVGATSLFAALLHARAGQVEPRVALLFGGAGMAGALAGSRLTRHVAPDLLLLLFAGVMVAAGVAMASGRGRAAEAGAAREPSWPATGAAGAGVGVLTGFLGVGGGFLAVPALVLFAGLPMKRAIGTSLAVIALNSGAGFAGHLGQETIDVPRTLLFTAAALAGALAGGLLSRRTSPGGLRRAFGVFVVAVGLFVAGRSLPALVSGR